MLQQQNITPFLFLTGIGERKGFNLKSVKKEKTENRAMNIGWTMLLRDMCSYSASMALSFNPEKLDSAVNNSLIDQFSDKKILKSEYLCELNICVTSSVFGMRIVDTNCRVECVM